MARQTVDEQLNAEYEAMAAGGKQFLGWTVLDYKSPIRKLVARTRAQTILDYGSGQGLAWPRLAAELGVSVKKYDPAIPRLAKKPTGTFDGVTCVDVLEHVPIELVDNVIADLFEYATRFVFVTTCPRAAKKFFSDGVTNLHVTQRPADWWLAKLRSANINDVLLLHRETP